MKAIKPKKEKRERYNIALLPSIKKDASNKASKERKSFSRLIENLLYDYLDDQN